MQREQCQFIDVRELGEFETAKVEGFSLYPLSLASTWLETMSANFDREKDTYVLCHHGVRSMHVCQLLATQGFERLYNVSGGIARYSDEVDPSIPHY